MNSQGSAALPFRVFVSYARVDIAFAQRLVGALEARGIKVQIDTRDLPTLEDWRRELLGLIRSCDAVIFIVSTASVSSKVCAWEIEQVEKHNKRLAPVVIERVPDDRIPQQIAKINYLYFDGIEAFEAQVDRLAGALQTNSLWIREHTRLTEAARRWAERGSRSELLLSGEELDAAEQWISTRPLHAPELTEAVQAFIFESRRSATRIQRNWVAGSLAIALIALVLTGFAYWQREQAIVHAQVAERARAAESTQRLAADASALEAREQRAQALKERDQALIAQSLFLNESAQTRSEKGDHVGAALLALEALPEKGNRPLIWQAVKTLADVVALASAERCVLPAFHANDAPAWSPTGHAIATRKGNEVLVYRTEDCSLQHSLTGPRELVTSVAWSPDGKLIAGAGADYRTVIWNAISGKIVQTLVGHLDVVNHVDFDSTSTRLVTSSSDGTARVWLVDTGHQLSVHGNANVSSNSIIRSRFSPNGSSVLSMVYQSTSAEGVRHAPALLWDAETGRLLRELGVSGERVLGAQFLLGGLIIGYIADDSDAFVAKQGLLRLMAVPEMKEIALPDAWQEIKVSAIFSEDQRLAVLAADGDLAVMTLEAKGIGPLIDSVSSLTQATAMTLHPKMGVVRSMPDQTIRFTVGGAELGTFAGHLEGNNIFNIHSLAFDVSGRYLASASMDGTVRIWDFYAVDNRFTRLPFPQGRHLSTIVDIDSTGQWVVSADGDRANIWEVPSKSVYSADGAHANRISAIAIDQSSSKFASGDANGSVAIWSLPAGTLLRKFDAHRDLIQSIRFSKDGRELVTVGGGGESPDPVIRIWDAETGQSTQTLSGRQGLHFDADFIPSINAIIVLTEVRRGLKTVYVLDRRTGSEIFNLEVSEELSSFAVDDAGERILVSGTSGIAVFSGKRYATRNTIELPYNTITRPLFLPNEDRIAFLADDSFVIWDIREKAPVAVRPGGGLSMLVRGRDSTMIQFVSSDGVVRRHLVPSSHDDEIATARAKMPRCLGPGERHRAFLDKRPPTWCLQRRLWPYYMGVDFSDEGATNKQRADDEDASWKERMSLASAPEEAMKRLEFIEAFRLARKRRERIVLSYDVRERRGYARGSPQHLARAWAEEAWAAILAGRPAAGEQAINEALRVAPAYTFMKSLLAHAKLLMGRTEEATELYAEVVEAGYSNVVMAELKEIARASGTRLAQHSFLLNQLGTLAENEGSDSQKARLSAYLHLGPDFVVELAHSSMEAQRLGFPQIAMEWEKVRLYGSELNLGSDSDATLTRVPLLVYISYYAVLAGRYAEALEYASQAERLEPSNIYALTNKAHALLFLGRVAEAESIYVGNIGKVAPDGQSWSNMILGDFDELEKFGQKHELMISLRQRL